MSGFRCSPCFLTAPVSWLRVTNTPRQHKQDSSSLRVAATVFLIYLFTCPLTWRITSWTATSAGWPPVRCQSICGAWRLFFLFSRLAKRRARPCSLIMGGKWKDRRQLYPCVAPASACRARSSPSVLFSRLPLKYLKCKRGGGLYGKSMRRDSPAEATGPTCGRGLFVLKGSYLAHLPAGNTTLISIFIWL